MMLSMTGFKTIKKLKNQSEKYTYPLDKKKGKLSANFFEKIDLLDKINGYDLSAVAIAAYPKKPKNEDDQGNLLIVFTKPGSMVRNSEDELFYDEIAISFHICSPQQQDRLSGRKYRKK
jgi:hypothetical protein